MGFWKCAGYMALIGVLSFILGRILPASWFHETSFPYRCFRWEKSGAVYRSIRIQKWQKKLPDMSRLFPFLMQEKKIGPDFQKELPLMIKETCIAEFIHVLLCFAGLYFLHLWPGAGGITVWILYTLGNLPFILIQRYNRPRLLGVQAKIAGRRACA